MDENDAKVLVKSGVGDLDIAGCGCFAFLIVCVICATVLALAWTGHIL